MQALIAARLDTLSPGRKSLLQDASVVGKVFWAGALAEMGGRDPREVEQALHELSRKELVRPARTSSMEGEAEHGFWHLLVRDVCYAQIPRAARAERHLAAAAWIERKAGERAEDLAELLAHHHVQALELLRAAGQQTDARELEAAAGRYLALAGERALALDVERAEANLAKALALCPTGDPGRASLLERWALAAQQLGRLREARAALEEAIELYRQHGDSVAAGRTLAALMPVLSNLGDPHREEVLAEAIALLEAEPPGPELVAAYGELAGVYVVFRSEYPEAIVAADRALELAAELGLPEPARALGFRGSARASLGDREGLDDLRRALALSVDRGGSRDAGIIHINLSEALSYYDGPEAALEPPVRGSTSPSGAASPRSSSILAPSSWATWRRPAARRRRRPSRCRWRPSSRRPSRSLGSACSPCSCTCSRSVANRSLRRAMRNGSPPRHAAPPRPSRSPPGSPPQRACFSPAVGRMRRTHFSWSSSRPPASAAR